GVHEALEVAVASTEQVRQGATEGVDDAVLVVIGEVLLAHRVGQQRAHGGGQTGGGDLVVREHGLDRLLRVQVHAHLVAGQGGEGGLVVVAEGDVVQTPAPPLVPLDLACAQPIAHADSSSSRAAAPRTSS